MAILEEDNAQLIKKIEDLHDLVNRTNWAKLNSEGFVFELERSVSRLKEIYELLKKINREMVILLEKNTPNSDEYLILLKRELIVLESNIKMEKTKRFRIELVNETEKKDVPELYKFLQTKILELCLKARYESEKISRFLEGRKMPFVKKGETAKNLLDILNRKEDELNEIKKHNLEMKRKMFLGTEEKSLADIEEEMYEKDKNLSEVVKDARKALKTHFAQIEYVEASFKQLENKVSSIEDIHENFEKKALELIRELKKERDYARQMALEIESETFKVRQEHMQQILRFEEKKNELKERIEIKYKKEIENLRKELRDKSNSMENMQKLINKQEEEIKNLKK